ncbi:hypothetical protein [Streptomyces acidicola]|uniref:Uncharacterized protein n=1 Tax=Streptomyces acidicola TaxID=2596892 RepID=A0A5N8X091_9ACTN|nr:hypothetical protein [Streptomyces acidicola]MPY52404.1 hypothetical protein [Streptomyces acidicola]
MPGESGESEQAGESEQSGEPGKLGESLQPGEAGELSLERRRLAEEKKNERYVWWYLAYFLFGIHLVAFVMIYAVLHAK